jgi:hypothetical protein
MVEVYAETRIGASGRYRGRKLDGESDWQDGILRAGWPNPRKLAAIANRRAGLTTHLQERFLRSRLVDEAAFWVGA